MSIELDNPETVLGKVDAIGNFIQQIRIAFMVGDDKRVTFAISEAERLVTLAMEQLEEQA